MIKDYDYEFRIEDVSKVLSEDLGLFNGYIESLILDSDKKCHIKICVKENEKIVLFEDYEYYGASYLPLRVTPISNNAEMFNFSAQKYAINNSLVIYIEGQEGTTINLTLRMQTDNETI